MAKYKVSFYQSITTVDRQSMVVEADSPEHAQRKVETWGNTGLGLSDEEVCSGETEKEGEVVKSEFYGVDSRNEVTLIPEEMDEGDLAREIKRKARIYDVITLTS
jgi:hypothetical protein